ncbi:MAG: hypothetical protein H7Y09_08475, partial [Chitinophagaceae bacterium]|nr:hypothetical protein [Anaerolineae bacterium]
MSSSSPIPRKMILLYRPLMGIALTAILIVISLHLSEMVALASIDDSTAITWTTVASQSYGSLEAQGTVLNSLFYFFGGYDTTKRPNWVPSRRTYVYNPTNNAWTRLADMPKGVTHSGMTTDGRYIYYAGGYTENASQTGQIFATSEVWRYDPIANIYTAITALPQARASGSLQYVNGELHFIGGTNLQRQDRGDHWMLNIAGGATQWVVEPALANPRNHAGSTVHQGMIYYVGGSHGQDPNVTTQNDLSVYNLQTNTWTELADIPSPRNHISASTVSVGNRIFVIAGDEKFNWTRKTIFAYTPATNTWA